MANFRTFNFIKEEREGNEQKARIEFSENISLEMTGFFNEEGNVIEINFANDVFYEALNSEDYYRQTEARKIVCYAVGKFNNNTDEEIAEMIERNIGGLN